MSQGCVVFSHGKDSEPWGLKIVALAETARCEGYAVESLDYRGVDSVQTRVSMLIDACKSVRGDLVLVGSSLGGFVSLAAAAALHAHGVFLLAPAIYMEGLPPLRRAGVDCPVSIVHGLHDDVVPYEHSVRFAGEHGSTLHLVNGDHRLHDQMMFIKYVFEYFLIELDLPRMRN